MPLMLLMLLTLWGPHLHLETCVVLGNWVLETWPETAVYPGFEYGGISCSIEQDMAIW